RESFNPDSDQPGDDVPRLAFLGNDESNRALRIEQPAAPHGDGGGMPDVEGPLDVAAAKSQHIACVEQLDVARQELFKRFWSEPLGLWKFAENLWPSGIDHLHAWPVVGHGRLRAEKVLDKGVAVVEL